MVAQRFKVIAFWGIVLFVGIQVSATIFTVLLGPLIGIAFSVLVVAGLAGFVGYKNSLALKSDPAYKERNMRILAGVLPAFIASLLTTITVYFLTGELKYSSGFVPLIAGAMGGYLAAKKK